MYRISKKDKHDLIEYYKQNVVAYAELSKKFGICCPTIGKIIKEAGLKPYTKTRIYNPTIDENYFSNIDSANKAYFLGLIVTDDNLYRNPKGENIVSLTLSENDRYLLEIFRKELGLKKEISFDGRGCCQLSILSNKLYSDLENLGVEPRKSTTISSLPQVPDQYVRDLIRGIIDGDGSIQAHQTKSRFKHSLGISSGNALFLKDFANTLYKFINIKHNKIYEYQDKQTCMLTWASYQDMYEFYKFLYYPGCICMTRKLDKLIFALKHKGYLINDNTEITSQIKA